MLINGVEIIFINIIIHTCKIQLRETIGTINAESTRLQIHERCTNKGRRLPNSTIQGKKDRKERNRATDRQVIKAARESKSGGI